jgi:hypothetical protein
MLYMVVNTHNPESCAARGEDIERTFNPALERFEQGSDELGVKVIGSWLSRSLHELFVLIDAPNAHAIDDWVLDSGVLGWSDSRILPVITRKGLADQE